LTDPRNRDDEGCDPAQGARKHRAKLEFFEENARSLERCANTSEERLAAHGHLWTRGNGGSACDAQHVAVEFMYPIIEKRRLLLASALTIDAALVTAIDNDTDCSHVFVRQLELPAHPGDIAIGISTPGSSANVNRALKRAREMDVLAVGRDGGRMAELCDRGFIVKSWSIHLIQGTHTLLLHLMWDQMHVAMGADDVI